MNKTVAVSAIALLSFAGVAAAQISSINGFHVITRNFNDFPGSTLTVNGIAAPAGANGNVAINGLGAGLHYSEQFSRGEPGNFANRHLGHFSADGGVTNYAFQNNQSFRLDTTISITAGSNGPAAKEGGITVFNNRTVFENGQNVTFTDEGFMLVKTNGGVNGGGEVALFGGALPFFSFNSVGVDYAPGTTASIAFTYFAPGELGAAAAYEASFNGISTGIKFFDNNSDVSGNGLGNGSLIGLRAQNSRLPTIADFADTDYGNISIIPGPGAAGLLGLAGLVALRRRR